MSRTWLVLLTLFFCSICLGQSSGQLILKGQYSSSDSIQIFEAYNKATLAVERMLNGIEQIWEVADGSARSKEEARAERWREDPAFMEWLGEPERISAVRRKILRIHSKFGKKLTLEVKKDNKGRCTGWISAWTIPFGKLKIRLCEDFFIYRTHLQEKVLIHEMGHEIGILFHRKVHGCRAARRAANSNNGQIAKKSTENYAWLAASYLGISCSSK